MARQRELGGRMLGDLCVIVVFKIALFAPRLLSQISYRGAVGFFCGCPHGGDNNAVHVDGELADFFSPTTRGEV